MRPSLILALLLPACSPAADDTGSSDAQTGSATTLATSSGELDETTGEPTTSTDTDASSDTGADTHDTDVLPVEFQCQPGVRPSDPYIDCVESFTPEGAVFGQDRLPEVVYGPPMHVPTNLCSLDVLSLGCGGEITL